VPCIDFYSTFPRCTAFDCNETIQAHFDIKSKKSYDANAGNQQAVSKENVRRTQEGEGTESPQSPPCLLESNEDLPLSRISRIEPKVRSKKRKEKEGPSIKFPEKNG
jgi:hypothetical protein